MDSRSPGWMSGGAHKYTHQIGVGAAAPVPHRAQQRIAGRYPSRVEGENAQNLVLGAGDQRRAPTGAAVTATQQRRGR